MPQPNAAIIVPTSVFWRTFSRRAFSTFKILPRIGRIAWNRAVASRFWQSRPQSLPQRYKFRRVQDLFLGSRSVCLEGVRCRELICAMSARALFWQLLGLRSDDRFFDDRLGNGGIFIEEDRQFFADICWTTEPTSLLPSVVWSALQIGDWRL